VLGYRKMALWSFVLKTLFRQDRSSDSELAVGIPHAIQKHEKKIGVIANRL
jgi:hypothetical protein